MVVLLCSTAALAACHRPQPLPTSPVYPARPRADATGLDGLAEAFAVRLAPAPDLSGTRLDPVAARRLALSNHPGVRSARAAVVEARAAVDAAGLWPNPEVGGRVLVDLDGGVSGEAALQFVLPLAGRVGAAEALALARLDAARLDLSAARRRALWEVDRLLIRLAHARARLALAERLTARARANLDLARSRLAAEVADPIEVALLAAQQSRDRREVDRLRAEQEAIARQVHLALGLMPGEVELTTPPLGVAALAEADEDLTRAALVSAPDVQRAKLAVLVAERRAGLSAAERAPDLSVGPAVAGSGEGLSLGVQAGVGLPFLDTGRAAYETALAQRDAAVEAYRQACRTAVAGVARTSGLLRARAEAATRIEGEASRQIAAAVALAEERFAAGRLDVLKLLSLHQAELAVEAEAADLARDWALMRLQLEEQVGRPVRFEEVR